MTKIISANGGRIYKYIGETLAGGHPEVVIAISTDADDAIVGESLLLGQENGFASPSPVDIEEATCGSHPQEAVVVIVEIPDLGEFLKRLEDKGIAVYL